MSEMTPEQYEALYGAPPNTTADLPAERPPEAMQATPAPPAPVQDWHASAAPPVAAPPAPPVQVAVYNTQNNTQTQNASGRNDVQAFYFNGGAGTFVGTALLGFAITAFTFGICYPFAVVLRQRWQAKHTYIQGRRLMFTGSAVGLLGNWIKWLLLMIVTIGIYSFWVVPRIVKWKTENLAFDPTHAA